MIQTFFGFQKNFGIVPFRLPCETACKEGHQIPFPAFINATEVCLVYYWTRTRMDSCKREVILKETSQRTPLINNKDESVMNKLIGSFEMAENQN